MQDVIGSGSVKVRKKVCAEVCVELLLIETVRLFYERQSGPAPSAALEAVGYRIGVQLVERSVE